MNNFKLQLNKMTVSNLSTEEMYNVGAGPGDYASSVKGCCDSHCDNNSSDRRCCSCDAVEGHVLPNLHM